MIERWVLNASPLISLATAEYEPLIRQLANDVVVPLAVASEILAGPADDRARAQIAGGEWTLVGASGCLPHLSAELKPDRIQRQQHLDRLFQQIGQTTADGQTAAAGGGDELNFEIAVVDQTQKQHDRLADALGQFGLTVEEPGLGGGQGGAGRWVEGEHGWLGQGNDSTYVPFWGGVSAEANRLTVGIVLAPQPFMSRLRN